MTIEEIEKEWQEAQERGMANNFAHLYVDELIAVAKAAARCWPVTTCDETGSCRSCDLKEALAKLEE